MQEAARKWPFIVANDAKTTPPPPIVPESAPFSAEQRAWLNGFFAGWMGTPSAGTPAATAAALNSNGAAPTNRISGVNGAAAAPAAPPAEVEEDVDDQEYPWHDPNLEIDERMEMAEGKSPKLKMMAAMAQLDCGACGYLCNSYSAAIASGEEKNLNLCSPGGKETAKMLKKIHKELGKEETAAPTASTAVAAIPATVADNEGATETPKGYTRTNPLWAKVVDVHNLNDEGSKKFTAHVVIDLKRCQLKYNVGDSLGVYPTNCPDLVDDILDAMLAHGTEHVVAPNGVETRLRDALLTGSNLRDVEEELVELVMNSTEDVEEKHELNELLENEDKLENVDVLDLVRMAPSARIDATDFTHTLASLQPRLYSIASSLKKHEDEVHLTIARVEYSLPGTDRLYKGVTSTMFSDRVHMGEAVRIYVHAAHGFTVPEDPKKPMIMVGPGTGIAPFRAFIEERSVTKAEGKNWLFFGDQHEATDFLYKDELLGYQEQGVLNRISTAFSRDQEQKVYVQDRMREEGAELFQWLEDGGYFFVCGDAKRMAVDVDRTLHEVIAEHGNLDEAGSKAYVAKLKEEKRYVRDVY